MLMEVSKAKYSEDGKELWITVRSSDGEFITLHIISSSIMLWEKSGTVLNLKEK